MRSKLWFLGLTCCSGRPNPARTTQRTTWTRSREAGRWSWSSEMARKLPPTRPRAENSSIEDQEYHAKLGANSVTATIKVDSSKTPKEIDLTFTAGEHKGKTVKGIYKIAGDDLTICRGLTEKELAPPSSPRRLIPVCYL